jgi:hypothetical protein
MKAAIRGMHSPDVHDLESYRPDDPEDVDVFIQVLAGPADGEGEESFNVQVVTPKALRRLAVESGPMIGRHHVIVLEWNWRVVHDFLVRTFEGQDALTWNELAERLGRIGHWEFEDYRPHPDERPS